ncbi:hypothetical protein [Saccharopolyspora cebuensis]|uniref:hypothetical protein n=1 Tax=Saccharopolyspora cebuensis TaxID=418759 RepID=UPI0031E63652
MGTVIGSAVFALVVLWVVADRLRAPFQSVRRGVGSVRRELRGSATSSGHVEVTVWKAQPLSDHMIKEIAVAEGFAYSGETSRYGSVMLRFVPRGEGVVGRA